MRYDRHSSGRRVAATLKPPTRGLREQRHRPPTWRCSGWRLPRFTRPARTRSDSSLWPCSSPSPPRERRLIADGRYPSSRSVEPGLSSAVQTHGSDDLADFGIGMMRTSVRNCKDAGGSGTILANRVGSIRDRYQPREIVSDLIIGRCAVPRPGPSAAGAHRAGSRARRFARECRSHRRPGARLHRTGTGDESACGNRHGRAPVAPRRAGRARVPHGRCRRP